MAKPKFWFLSSSLLKPVSSPTKCFSPSYMTQNPFTHLLKSKFSVILNFSLYSITFFDEINQLCPLHEIIQTYPKVIWFSPSYHITHYNDLQISILSCQLPFDLFSNYSPLIDSGLDTLASLLFFSQARHVSTSWLCIFSFLSLEYLFSQIS